MMSTSNRILSGMADTSVFKSESDQKYENKCHISDIHLYPIRFHPYIQMIQEPKMIGVFKPIFFLFLLNSLCCFPLPLRKDFSQQFGIWSCMPSAVRIRNQNYQAIIHVVRRCWAFSSSRSHKGHGWGGHLLASWSAIQHLLHIASQIKNLHFAAAHDFHKRLQGSKAIEPLKNALICWFWRKLTWTIQSPNVFVRPESSSLHMCLSTSWERIVSWRISHNWNYSKRHIIDSPLLMSEAQLCSCSASATVHRLRVRSGTAATTVGASSSKENPMSHLSVLGGLSSKLNFVLIPEFMTFGME